MKINPDVRRPRRREGSAVILVLLLIAILLLYSNAALKTLHVLGQNIRLVEKHQLTQWQQSPPIGASASNQPPSTTR